MIRLILAAAALTATFSGLARAQAPGEITLTYVYLSHDTKAPAALRSLWADQMARNNATFPAFLKSVRAPNGDAPAHLLYAEHDGVRVSILQTREACAPAPNSASATQTWLICPVRVEYEGRTFRAEACFNDDSFGNSQRTATTTAAIDVARRAVEFNAYQAGRPIPECRSLARFG